MRWLLRHLFCRFVGHFPIDPAAPLCTCKVCGEVEKACAWCGLRRATYVASGGGTTEAVCRQCVGV